MTVYNKQNVQSEGCPWEVCYCILYRLRQHTYCKLSQYLECKMHYSKDAYSFSYNVTPFLLFPFPGMCSIS